jgi:hypothetical protein
LTGISDKASIAGRLPTLIPKVAMAIRRRSAAVPHQLNSASNHRRMRRWVAPSMAKGSSGTCLNHGFEAVARCADFFDFADKQHQWARRLGHGDQARPLRDAASVDFAASIDAEDFGNIQPMPSDACPSRQDCDEDCIRRQLSGGLKLPLIGKFCPLAAVGRRAPTDSCAA